MFIIKNIGDLCRIRAVGKISLGLFQHLAKKLEGLRNNLVPQSPLEAFSLEQYGPIVLFAGNELDLATIGIQGHLLDVIPESIEHISIWDEDYYVVYVMGNNDYITQIYISSATADITLLDWLSNQKVVNGGEEDVRKKAMSF